MNILYMILKVLLSLPVLPPFFAIVVATYHGAQRGAHDTFQHYPSTDLATATGTHRIVLSSKEGEDAALRQPLHVHHRPPHPLHLHPGHLAHYPATLGLLAAQVEGEGGF